MKMCEEGRLVVLWLIFFVPGRRCYYLTSVASHTSAVEVACAKGGETFLVLQQLENCDSLIFYHLLFQCLYNVDD